MHLSDRYDKNDIAVLSSPNVDQKEEKSSFSVEVITDNQAFDSLKREWDELADQANVHIFQLYFWMRTWWKYFGDGANLHIVLVREGEKLIGIAPMFTEKYSFLKLNSVRFLRLIGSTIPQKRVNTIFFRYGISDYLDFIVHPNKEEEAAQIIINYLKDPACKYDMAVFQDAPSNSFIMRKVVPKLEKRKWNILTEASDTCPCLKLPETLQDYLMSLDGKTRYKLRHTDRAVNQKHLFEIRDDSTIDKVPVALNNLVALHQQRWNNKGELGVFADPRYRPFILEICEKASLYKKLWMYSAYKGSRCIAVDCSFEYKGRVYDYLKAFDNEHPLSKYRPGMALQFKIIKRAIKTGGMIMDLLRGEERYKLKLTNQMHVNWNVMVEAPGGISRIKRSYHKLDDLLFRNNLAFRRALYLFKTGWGKQEQDYMPFVWDFLQFFMRKIKTRLLNRIKSTGKE